MQWLVALVMLPRRVKRGLLRMADVLLMTGCLLLAVMISGEWEALQGPEGAILLGVVALTTPLVLEVMGIYRIVLRYMNQHMALTLALGLLLSVVNLLVIDLLLGQLLSLHVLPVFALLVLVAVGGMRLLLRELYQLSRRPQRQPVVIYGAGEAGCELARALQHGGRYWPRAFVDDWRGLQGSLVEGLPVHHPDELDSLIQRLGLELVLLAIPSAPRCRRREILEKLARLSVPVQTIPGSEDLVSGRASVNDTCNVAVEDLLGREPVPAFPELTGADIRDKVVMVTGAGGSIGAELCRQILLQGPAVLVLVDNAEYALYTIEQELQRLLRSGASHSSVKAQLVSIQRGERMREILASFGVQTLYHAAAYKHVPLVEANLVEGIRNNVFGTLGLAMAAVEEKVETFVMVSTDKAVRPTNVMGATKRLTELMCQALAALETCSTRFCMVRFGNVLGSSGSVVPLFRRQIERGGPVEVTHPEITRFFMTIPEAAQLVIQAGAMGSGGEVFVLDMGEPVRIADLAANMIRLSGLEVKDDNHPDGDIEIVYTGLRPGEKLFEELLIGGDVHATRHPRIMTSREVFWEWPALEAFLGELYEAIQHSRHLRILQLLQEAPLDYRPADRMVDPVWQARHDRISSKLPAAGVGPREAPVSARVELQATKSV
ncbi:polysaccharide biosynthesis protein [Halomonas ventosae]|uniref:FlaA1/EpsC-like NDP-sugar epimerase n=1 Tax=Halomonas ventosae TaxID=229007 RepID=A0A2T0VB63_9GAMM|nr:nucleoside-diphosphate sugar epimerase/dehydratase [Halomonas ventosae]PRY67363.1 FlaA1/EpsC-like NDP-sugar epimerase [Halomonas ventosae]